MGNHRTYNDPKDLSRELDRILAQCEEEGIFPTDWVLAKRLNVSVRTLYNYKKIPEFAKSMERVSCYCENYLLQNCLNGGGKNATPLIFLLKQPKFGGYTDVQSSKQDIKVRIDFGGDPEDFK